MLSRKVQKGILAFCLALLFAAIPTWAAAQGDNPGLPPPPPAPGGKGAVGKIGAISSKSITVKTPDDNSLSYTLSASTTVTKDDRTVPLKDLAAGLFVIVTSTDGTTATAIDAHTKMGPPPGGRPSPGGPPPGAAGFGKITAISSKSITVTPRDGSGKTFTISSTTTVTKDGQTSAASDLSAGNFAEIYSDDGSSATKIIAHTGPPPPPGQGSPPGQGPPPDSGE